MEKEKIVQTAGRDALGEFAPAFAHYNDDVLFGENWNDDGIDVKTRSIITVVALMASGVTDSSLKFHLQNAKNHGVTQKEIAAIITHVAFYAGWPKGWAVFNMAKEIWTWKNKLSSKNLKSNKPQNSPGRFPRWNFPGSFVVSGFFSVFYGYRAYRSQTAPLSHFSTSVRRRWVSG